MTFYRFLWLQSLLWRVSLEVIPLLLELFAFLFKSIHVASILTVATVSWVQFSVGLRFLLLFYDRLFMPCISTLFLSRRLYPQTFSWMQQFLFCFSTGVLGWTYFYLSCLARYSKQFYKHWSRHCSLLYPGGIFFRLNACKTPGTSSLLVLDTLYHQDLFYRCHAKQLLGNEEILMYCLPPFHYQ